MARSSRTRRARSAARLGPTFTGLLIIGVAFVVAWSWSDRIVPGVRILDQDVGGLTKNAAAAKLSTTLQRDEVSVQAGSTRTTATWSELGLTFDVGRAVARAFRIGRQNPLELLLPPRVIPAITWDTPTLTSFLARAARPLGVPPHDAAIRVVDGVFVLTPDQPGVVADQAAFRAAVEEHLRSGKVSPVPVQVVTAAARLRTVDLAPALDEAERLAGASLELTVADHREVVTPDRLRTWVAFHLDRPAQVSSLGPIGISAPVHVGIDPEMIGSYLAILAAQVNAPAEPQMVLPSRERTEVVKSGKPGRALLVADAAVRLAAAVEAGERVVDLPLTEIPPPVLEASAPAAPIGLGKVIAVDLTQQHEYLFENGELVYSFPISSGIHDWTPTGTFHVYAKSAKQKMSGPGYYLPNVPWILWFKGDLSLHGVYWHKDFGIRPRSHGCVGASVADAERVFTWAEVGTPIVIFKS